MSKIQRTDYELKQKFGSDSVYNKNKITADKIVNREQKLQV